MSYSAPIAKEVSRMDSARQIGARRVTGGILARCWWVGNCLQNGDLMWNFAFFDFGMQVMQATVVQLPRGFRV